MRKQIDEQNASLSRIIVSRWQEGRNQRPRVKKAVLSLSRIIVSTWQEGRNQRPCVKKAVLWQTGH